MSLARITLALFVALPVCSIAEAQTNDSVTIIRATIESLEINSGHEPPWIATEKAMKETGLAGQWTVTSSIKDGEFSKAQIGQEPGDIISIGRTYSRIRTVTEIQVT